MQKQLERVIYFISFPVSFFGFILPLYANSLGATPLEVGLLFSIFSLTSVLIRPTVGRYIDLHGRKGAFLLGLILFTLVQAILFIGKSYTLILLARIFQSIGASFLWVSAYAMVADLHSEENYAGKYGSLLQASNRGDFIGCVIGFTLLFNFSGDSVYKLIFGLFFLVSLVAIFKARQMTETQKKELLKIEKERIMPGFKVFVLIVGFLALFSSMLAPVYLIYICENITKDLALISLAYIPGEILAIVLLRRLGNLADQYGKKRFMMLGLLLDALLVLLIPETRTILHFAMITLGLSLGSIMMSPARIALVSTFTRNRQFGRAYGYYYTSLGIGGILGPVLGTYIYQYFSPDWLFYLNSGGRLIGVVLIGLFIREGNRMMKTELAGTSREVV